MPFLQKLSRRLETSQHEIERGPLFACPQKSWLHKLLPTLLFFVLSLFFCSPLLKDLYSSGSGDWDNFMFLYEVPAITLFEFGQFPLWNPYCGGGISLIILSCWRGVCLTQKMESKQNPISHQVRE